MPYERERAFKVEILRETLRRIGGLHWEDEIKVLTATPWGYRNRTQLRVGRKEGRAVTGFLAPKAHRHVATHECAINSPKLNELHRALQRMASAPGFPESIRTVEFFTNEESVQMNFPRRSGPFPRRFWEWCSDQLGVSRAARPLYYQSGADRFRVSGRSFFQVNRFLVDKLTELAIGSMEGRLALDLYCGVGLLTLPLARRFDEVVGVDSGASAVRDLQSNANRAGLSLRAVHRDVAPFLTAWTRRPNLVVADPPRAGLGRAVVAQILRLAPPRLQLVSCDPATLARDIKALTAGGYGVEKLVLIDLFPQTYHFETVAALRLG